MIAACIIIVYIVIMYVLNRSREESVQRDWYVLSMLYSN